jgi:Uncharacterized protein conserved in bacteria
MKLFFVSVIVAFCLLVVSCQHKKPGRSKNSIAQDLFGRVNESGNQSFDSTLINNFYLKYPKLDQYKSDVSKIYRHYHFRQIWFDQKGIIEFGNSLFSKVVNIEDEGVFHGFPYPDEISSIFQGVEDRRLSNDETDFMITNMFLFYAKTVYKGIDEEESEGSGWLMPRKQVSYENLLDSVMQKPELLQRNDSVLFNQYYRLMDVLKEYRALEKSGGWDSIKWPRLVKNYKPGDSSSVILQIKKRLVMTGDLDTNNANNLYDKKLAAAIRNYQVRNGRIQQNLITPKLVDELNVPVSERIKTIAVNMERWRWISPGIASAKEFIFVNIPSFMLDYNKNGKIILESPVVVGKRMNKTVVFSGNLSYIVFSPYWNIPASIIEKEVKPAIRKNPNYLAENGMKWYGSQLRQLPGKKNSLGLVKFLFPNTNDIYLHDSPAKGLYNLEKRAFSHGCIRVGKPRDLAIKILEDDPDWSPEKIDEAMNSGVEKWYNLKKRIPVHIGYFTAWENDKGQISFYDDVYKKDESLFKLLVNRCDSIK